MSYTPTEWKAGDTVTSAKLNKIENGIGGLQNIVIQATASYDQVNGADWSNYITLPQNMPSYNDLITEYNNGMVPTLIVTLNGVKILYILTETSEYDDTYIATFVSFIQSSKVNCYINLLSDNADSPLGVPAPLPA